ncbi:Rieske (2Fe-2S) protein [Spirobacillus cienkowskii]|jgi:nitrite reductase/ring-hydroxylating ferredoxin subunit|uniref:Rieske domain-containing protein n=1 Tax=Spirobacillus cienkowskii TaxID=495820 RepID=A0A369KPI7_9BACT|nr:MAG: hypothetical protein DCC88_09930 [Spirobacillus cienkowskii]
MSFFRVCELSELPFEKPTQFLVDGLEILLVKSLHFDKVWAFDNNCNHADKPLEKGKWNAEAAEITCPFHKAVFSIVERGAVKAPPACVPLNVYSVEIRVEQDASVIYVSLD